MEMAKQELPMEPGAQERPAKSLAYHAYTLWLFTRSDIKTLVLPATVFAVSTTLSGPLLTTNASPDGYSILRRLPLVVLSTWMELLVVDVGNQLQAGSVVEDAVNKPWRPIPSGRIGPAAARHLLMAAIAATIVKSVLLGTMLETMMFLIFTWIYNDLGAADSHYVLRNLLNAIAIPTYAASAAAVAVTPTSAPSLPLHTYAVTPTLALTTPLAPRFYAWLPLVGLSIFVTIAAQDLPDMLGDAAKGRSTMPLVRGEGAARWSVALGLVGASAGCCVFWGAGWMGWAAVLGTGGVVGARAVALRGVGWDEGTWRGWCVWMAVVYCLPAWRRWEMVSAAGDGVGVGAVL